MVLSGKSLFILLCFIINSSFLSGQDCEKYYETGDCGSKIQKGYRLYSQSRSVNLSAGEFVELNVVFYGQQDYIFSFCTEEELYPVNFQLIDPENQDILYDNADDDYATSLAIGFDYTQNLIVTAGFIEHERKQPELEGVTGCLGVLFQHKKY